MRSDVAPVQLCETVPEEILLLQDDVQVWRTRLDQPQTKVTNLFRTLAPDEKERAARFYFQKDRDHFIVARGTLRAILGRRLKVRPDELCFGYSSFGKPFLVSDNCGDLHFNLSHSHGLALFAVAFGRELGIDVERMRAEVIKEQIAERFFSCSEVAVLRALPASQQVEAFFNCWTRKEAYIKARGEGLSLPLDKFDVSLAPAEPAALLQTRIDANEVNRWSMMDLAPGAGFKAALVVERRN